MADDEREWYEQLLELQLEANPALWAQLQEQGADEQTPLRIAFVYLAPGEEEAVRLADFLRAETDYEVKAHSQREGRRKQPDWYVAGTTQPTAVSAETIDAWVEWMIAAGAGEGPCAFDGWAASIATDVIADP